MFPKAKGEYAMAVQYNEIQELLRRRSDLHISIIAAFILNP